MVPRVVAPADKVEWQQQRALQALAVVVVSPIILAAQVRHQDF